MGGEFGCRQPQYLTTPAGPYPTLAQVLVDGRVVGRLERSNPRNLTLPAAPGGNEDAVLDILVEALGRVNFGCEWDFKGLTSPDVRLTGALLICCICSPPGVLQCTTFTCKTSSGSNSLPSLSCQRVCGT